MSDMTSAWLASPSDSASVGAGNEAIQDVKETFHTRISREHHESLTEVSPQTKHGVHKAGSAVSFAQAAAPTLRPDGVTTLNADDHGRLWIDTDTGVMYFWKWDSGTSSGAWTECAPAHGLVLLTSGTSWTATWTGPVKVTCVGGGGGGGGAASSSGSFRTSGGGGAGATVEHIYNVVAGTAYTYAIGAAGSAGTFSADGGNGGDTTFTDGTTLITAGGGRGGAYITNGAAGSATGAGGTASGASLNINGQNGSLITLGSGASSSPSFGGSGPFGAGGMSGFNTLSAPSTTAPSGYGAGGQGFSSSNSGGDGSAGTAGCIIIEW